MSLRDEAEARQGGGTVQRQTKADAERQAEIARRDALEERLGRMKDRIAQAMPKGDADQFATDAFTAFRTVRDLDKCEPLTVMGALMTIAQLGLRPAVNGQAWPMPFWSSRNRRFEAQVVIGYKGYTHLMWDSGKIASLAARTVYEHDKFEIDLGTDERLVHQPFRGLMKDRGPITDYYFRWSTVFGGSSFFHMTHEEVIQWRDTYAKRNQQGAFVGVWAKEPNTTEFQAMAWKTCMRRAVRFLPSSNGLATAAQVDETVRVDVSPTAEPGSVSIHQREAIEGTLAGEPVDPERENDRAKGAGEPEPGVIDNLPPADQDPTVNGEMGERRG